MELVARRGTGHTAARLIGVLGIAAGFALFAALGRVVLPFRPRRKQARHAFAPAPTPAPVLEEQAPVEEPVAEEPVAVAQEPLAVADEPVAEVPEDEPPAVAEAPVVEQQPAFNWTPAPAPALAPVPAPAPAAAEPAWTPAPAATPVPAPAPAAAPAVPTLELSYWSPAPERPDLTA